MLTLLKSSLQVFVMISSISVPICNNFQARPANIGKLTSFLQEVPLFCGDPLTQRHEILFRNTRDSTLSYGENSKSLSHLRLNRYRVVTDGQRDGQNYRS